MTLSEEQKTRLSKESHSKLRSAILYLRRAEKEDPNHERAETRRLYATVQHFLNRSLFGVHERADWYFTTEHKFVKTNKLTDGKKEITNWRQYRLLEENQDYLRHVTLLDASNLNVLVYLFQQKGWQFIGSKASDKRMHAIFMKGDTFEEAMNTVVGEKITDSIIKSDKLKDIQSLVVLLCREGMISMEESTIDLSNYYRSADETYDGLCIKMTAADFQKLKYQYMLPENTRWIQITYLNPEQGVGMKGAIMQCETDENPCIYTEGIKFGLPEYLDTKYLRVMNCDSLYKPKPSMNLQMLVYNYTRPEQAEITKKLFLPKILEDDWSDYRNLHSKHKLATLGIFINPDMVKKLQFSFLIKKIRQAMLDGIRVKAVPDHTLPPYTIRVPYTLGWETNQTVEIHRDPSLPIGNGTQRVKVIGYTEGNYIALSKDPWTTVMGGDFDGDDVAAFLNVCKMLPDKTYDSTPMTEFIDKKMKTRTGVKQLERRYYQAKKALESKGSIGIFDVAARRLEEEGLLETDNRLELSSSIQKAIDSAKHDVDIPAPSKIANSDKISGLGIIRDLINYRTLDTLEVQMISELSNPIYKAILTAFIYKQRQPLPKTNKINMDAARGKLEQLCAADLTKPSKLRPETKKFISWFNYGIEENKGNEFTEDIVSQYRLMMQATEISNITWCLSAIVCGGLPLACRAFDIEEIAEALDGVTTQPFTTSGL